MNGTSSGRPGETPRSTPPAREASVPRSTPGAPRSTPGAPRSTPGAPRSTPGAPRATPDAPRSTPAAPRSPEGDREALRSDSRLTDLEAVKHGKDKVKNRTQESLRNLRKGLHRISVEARRGRDRTPFIHTRWTRKAENQLKKIEEKFFAEIENLIPEQPLSHEDYQNLIKKINEIVDKHEKDATSYSQALAYSVRALAGVSGVLKPEHYALFESLLENINLLYSQDVKIVDVILRVQQKTMESKDWDLICSYIEKYPYQKDVQQDRDRINLSITALFVQMMDANQRYKLVLEYHKRNNNNVNKTSDLIRTFTETGVVNIAQMRELMREITDGKYNMSAEEERRILERQEQVARLTQEISRKMDSPLRINSAERLFNARSLASCAAVAIGSLGMITNYLAAFNSTTGPGRYIAGLSSPHFLLSAGIAATGAHFLPSGMRPGATPGTWDGFIDKILGKPKRPDNPFGHVDRNYNKVEEIDARFTELVGLCTTYINVQKYLFEADGFADIMEFYRAKQVSTRRMEQEARIREVTSPRQRRRRDVFEEFMEYVEKERNNGKGKEFLKKIDEGYGRRAARQILFRLFVSVRTLGIASSRSFREDKIPHQQFTYYQLYRHRAGLEPLRVPINPPPDTSTRGPAAAPSSPTAPTTRPSGPTPPTAPTTRPSGPSSPPAPSSSSTP